MSHTPAFIFAGVVAAGGPLALASAVATVICMSNRLRRARREFPGLEVETLNASPKTRNNFSYK